MHSTTRSFWIVATACLLACAAYAAPEKARPRALDDDHTQESDEAATVPALTPAELAHLALYVEPSLTPAQMAQVLARYRRIDPTHVVPQSLHDRAIAYYDANKDHIDNKQYLSVVDFDTNSSLPRFFIMDMTSGAVRALHVAHGKGSDPDNDGLAVFFSNAPNSEMSSLGFYRTAEPYTGTHGLSCRLDGLSPTNSNVRKRAVVIHGADYVEDTNIQPGRSWGCLAVSMANHTLVVNALKAGSIILAGRSRAP